MTHCGYVKPKSELPSGFGEAACARETWNNTGRCIWHADENQKPATEMERIRIIGPERIDDLIVRNTDIAHRIDFEQCTLVNADFSGTRLAGCDFTGAYLRKADFTGCQMRSAEFDDVMANSAHFSNSWGAGTTFTNADLVHAVFTSTNPMPTIFSEADFTDADLFDADFSKADISGSDFHGARLRHAEFLDTQAQSVDFRDSDLRNASFVYARLHNAVFGNARIATSTEFGNHAASELIADQIAESVPMLAKVKLDVIRFIHWIVHKPILSLRKYEDMGKWCLITIVLKLFLFPFRIITGYLPTVPRPSSIDANSIILSNSSAYPRTRRERFRMAIRRFYNRISLELGRRESHNRRLKEGIATYQLLRHQLKTTPLKDEYERFYLRSRHAKRKVAFSNQQYWKWMKLTLSRITIRYGASPWRPGFFGIGVIGLSALAYPIWGLRTTSGSENVLLQYGADEPLLSVITESLYFSLGAFTTLGYNGVQPTGLGKMIAMIEAGIGSILIALIVFVLGWRTTR
ncbi:pentapeptide repeat-containing protein [Haloarcula sp. GH36]|uniref:pentapeptide repeat-containing protein n=1 Tax=Haloarcula montana TaxID=3111776 RepID=UPI002D7A2910|nr:pentapeptide repeat-containing protein [Haloarcula sp. GH36]